MLLYHKAITKKPRIRKLRVIDLFIHKEYYQIYSFITVACNKYVDFVSGGFIDVRSVYIELYKGYFELLENKIPIGKVAKKFCDCNDMLTASNFSIINSQKHGSVYIHIPQETLIN